MRILRPLRNCVLVEPIRHGTETVRGIHIPEAHRDSHPSMDAIVLARGPKASDEIKVGDRVVIDRFSGIDVKHKGRDFKLIPSPDLLAIIE